MGEAAAADKKAAEYISLYGKDSQIERLQAEIDKWLNNIRREKMGKAQELKKDILKDFYLGKMETARVKLANLKLMAPNYEDSLYLEYLLNASEFLEQGMYAEAEKELVEALKIDPDSEEVKNLYDRLKEVIKLSE